MCSPTEEGSPTRLAAAFKARSALRGSQGSPSSVVNTYRVGCHSEPALSRSTLWWCARRAAAAPRQGRGGSLGETSAFSFGYNELAGDPCESAAYLQQLLVKVNVGPKASASPRRNPVFTSSSNSGAYRLGFAASSSGRT